MIETSYCDGVAHLKLNAPPLNILSRAMLAELRLALAKAAHDTRARVLLLGAAGKHFSAGASVEEHLPPLYQEMLPEFADTVIALHEFPLPVIAAVQGRCLGGGFELVQAADLIVAADNAQFGQPEIVLGVFPPAACALLADHIGPAHAAEILFTGDAITAEQARDMGLVARTVPVDELDQQAGCIATRMARHSGAALRALKRAMRAVMPPRHVRYRVDAATRIYTEDLMRTHDALEGLRAFLEKRQPEWSHQ